MYGLTFNGLHSFNDLGLIMLSKTRVLLSAAKDEYVDIPGMDGSHLYPGALPDKVHEIEFAVKTTGITALKAKMRQVAAWLRTKGRSNLVF